MSTFRPSTSSPSKFYPTSPPSHSSATRPFRNSLAGALSLNGPCLLGENNNNFPENNNNEDEPSTNLLVPIANNNNLQHSPQANQPLLRQKPYRRPTYGRVPNGGIPIVPVLPPSLRYYGYRVPAFHFFPLANPYFIRTRGLNDLYSYSRRQKC